MSRRSFYRSSRQGTAGPYVADIDEKITHWSRDWVSPQLPAQQLQQQSSSSVTPAPNADEAESPNPNEQLKSNQFGFTVKTWILVDDEDYVPVKDGDDGDTLDIDVFTQANLSKEQPVPETGALTAADIRGAVGGEAIPGIASGYSGTTKETQETQETGEAKPEEVKTKEVKPEVNTATTDAPASAEIPAIEPAATVAEPAAITEPTESNSNETQEPNDVTMEEAS